MRESSRFEGSERDCFGAAINHLEHRMSAWLLPDAVLVREACKPARISCATRRKGILEFSVDGCVALSITPACRECSGSELTAIGVHFWSNYKSCGVSSARESMRLR